MNDINPFGGIIARQNLLKSRLEAGCLNPIKVDDSIEKGGEGSRGGKVIGHTRSGKPVYEGHGPKHTPDFTKQDHKDAGEIHYQHKEQNMETMSDTQFHKTSSNANAHHDKALQMEKQEDLAEKRKIIKAKHDAEGDGEQIAGKGPKAVHSNKHDYPNFNYNDHKKAALAHFYEAVSASEEGDKDKERHHKDMSDHHHDEANRVQKRDREAKKQA